jgi:predicted DNA-binding protein with PD1-like motif
MNVCEANRPRHLVIRLDRGEELPAALVRALGQVEARAGFVVGLGALEAAELAHYDQTRRTYGDARRIDAPCEVVSLTGNVATLDGATSVRLSATLTRETDAGLSTIGGQLVWGRVFALELHVTVLDDLVLSRVADERTGLPVLDARRMQGTPIVVVTGAESAPSPAPATAPTVSASTQATPAPATSARPASHDGPARPVRPVKVEQEMEQYPEVGDVVIHFHFGECTVVTSDGDRIRVRQDKDGRVLDVALMKLRIEPAGETAEGKRIFRLHRKN